MEAQTPIYIFLFMAILILPSHYSIIYFYCRFSQVQRGRFESETASIFYSCRGYRGGSLCRAVLLSVLKEGPASSLLEENGTSVLVRNH